MVKGKKTPSVVREKWFSVAIRLAWFTDAPHSTIMEFTMRAENKSDAIDRAQVLFHYRHYDEELTHYFIEGVRVYPWNVSAIQFPKPIARTLDAKVVVEKISRKKLPKHKILSGTVIQLFPQKQKLDEDVPSEPPQSPNPPTPPGSKKPDEEKT